MGEYIIIYANQAVKQINSIPSTQRSKIKIAIEKIPDGDIKKLKGYTTIYRLRVGNYRVIYSIIKNQIQIMAVLPRKDVYKKNYKEN